MAKGFGELGIAIIWLLILSLLTTITYKIYHADPNDQDNIFLSLLMLLFAILCFIPFGMYIYDALLYLIAPEWFAIKEILNLIN